MNPKTDSKSIPITTVPKKAPAAKAVVGICELCEAKNTDLYYCKIKDALGVRYRNICMDCITSNAAERVEK